MSTTTKHTFGEKCRLASVPHVEGADGRPPIEAQFFYASVIPIDDPLSATSTIATSDARPGKTPLRPFARGDNNALEKAWISLQTEEDQSAHGNAKNGREATPEVDKPSTEKRTLLVQSLALRHCELHKGGLQPQELSLPVEVAATARNETACCTALSTDVGEELERTFCSLAREVSPSLTIESVVKDVVSIVDRLRASDARLAEEANDREQEVAATKRLSTGSLPRSPRDSLKFSTPASKVKAALRSEGAYADAPESTRRHDGRARSGSQPTSHSSRAQTPVGSPAQSRGPMADDGISGQPFVRVPSSGGPPKPVIPIARYGTLTQEEAHDANIDHVEVLEDPKLEAIKLAEAVKATKWGKEAIDVPVGVSRLHMVSLPNLQMKPIYWSPINDMAVVTRATWFYRDTMLPVPCIVANQLEAGYHDLRPWSQTWADEVKCAIDIGALGEEKVAHCLWPKDVTRKTAKSHGGAHPSRTHPPISADPYCAARCFRGEAAAEGSIEPSKTTHGDTDASNWPFQNYHVIYKDDKVAFLLKPSLSPSAYYGRRPLSKIMKGITVGIPVVRGFDRPKWERKHEKKPTQRVSEASPPLASRGEQGEPVCPGCEAEKNRGQVTELVLVAHGIGQKFAERVESFHFTHAINGFRRAVNIELGTPLVQGILRESQNGMMILPLNWRLGLSFEEGGPMHEEDKVYQATDGFGLKDIEPTTIPAVRSMISDVMFDIPFYMSHHKNKMIKALVTEANRVYRLWCRNNPGFAEHGRVHLIGHSLGSAMALEVLSRQPTSVPHLNLSQPEPETSFFEFDTKNLFLVGSPAGFFLLLERGSLLPRHGRSKPGAEPADTTASGVVGEAGTFGCLAVDNIYNILAKEDPIAYLLNGAVDPTYAASLKVAHVPSTASSFFKAFGDAFRYVIPGMQPAQRTFAPEPARPPAFRLPSQLELEVHDFTREEIAEKKVFLLNDNGQIDYYLRSGGGPLEIQYLNMLSAHTSYWTNLDFIRMLCIEVGREPGRGNTLPAMRAVKATKRLIP